MAKKSYHVILNVTGYFGVDVDANSPEEADEKAHEAACDADFGELYNIDWERLSIEKNDPESAE